jgi:hypothetical protein
MGPYLRFTREIVLPPNPPSGGQRLPTILDAVVGVWLIIRHHYRNQNQNQNRIRKVINTLLSH